MRRGFQRPAALPWVSGLAVGPIGLVSAREVSDAGGGILGPGWSVVPFLLLSLFALIAAAGCLLLFLRQRHRAARAERTLEVQRLLLTQHYQNLSRHANDLILLSDGMGRILEANERALTRYGYSRERMLGMNLADLGAADPSDAGLGLPFETEHLDSSGHRFPVEVCVRLVDVAGRRFRQSIMLDLTERKRAEAALHESAQRFQTLTDLAPSGIFQTDCHGRLLYANHLMREIADLTQEQTGGQDWLGAIHPGDREAILPQWHSCLEKGEPISAEFRYRTATGRETPVLCHAAALRSATGGIEGFIGVVSDISRIREAELREQRSAETVRMIVEGAPAGIVAVDLQGQITLWNGASEAMFGWRREEVIGQPVRGVPPEEREHLSRLREVVLAGGTVSGTEVTRLRKDGGQVAVSLTAAPLRDAAGVIAGMMSIMVEITERRAAEKALRDTAELLRMSQRMAQLGSWRVRFPRWPCAESEEDWEWSDETYRILGVVPGSFAPTWAGLLALIHPEDQTIVRHHSRIALDRGGRYEVDHRVIRPDGSIRHVHEQAEIELSESGRPQRMTGTIQDTTTYRKLEDQLIQAQKLDGLGRLAGGVAHDFNNLLTVILGFSEMLLESLQLPGESRQHAEEIQRAASRAEYLVRQLLAFGRKQVLSPRSTDLNRVITESERMLVVLLGEDSQLITKLSPGLPEIWADPPQIEQVLMNLVVNARDAMPSGGRLTIETAVVEVDSGEDPVPGRYAELTVTDTGTGIDAETLRHLFEPFFTTKPQGQGVGLGLASVYGIVHQSQGAVRVRSRPGHGSVFQVLLPLSTVEMRIASPVRQSELVSAQGRTILVVDDEDGIRKVVSLTLRRRGYHVLEAEQAEEALHLSGEFSGDIHLLVTDVVLPGMNGQELANFILAARPNMGVIFCSGYPKGSRFELSLEQGAFDYLQKPFSAGVLLAHVEAMILRTSV